MGGTVIAVKRFSTRGSDVVTIKELYINSVTNWDNNITNGSRVSWIILNILYYYMQNMTISHHTTREMQKLVIFLSKKTYTYLKYKWKIIAPQWRPNPHSAQWEGVQFKISIFYLCDVCKYSELVECTCALLYRNIYILYIGFHGCVSLGKQILLDFTCRKKS